MVGVAGMETLSMLVDIVFTAPVDTKFDVLNRLDVAGVLTRVANVVLSRLEVCTAVRLETDVCTGIELVLIDVKAGSEVVKLRLVSTVVPSDGKLVDSCTAEGVESRVFNDTPLVGIVALASEGSPLTDTEDILVPEFVETLV